jgi:hypothetical protein
VALIEQVSQDVVAVPAEWSLTEAYGKLGGKVFYIEPLSARMPLADFILGGGLGWGSLRHGSFASKLYKVQTDKFAFGSDHATSVNAGYPLHRLVEGMPHDLCPLPDAKIERVTIPVRPKPQVKAVFRACSLADARLPVPAANFVWVNAASASALGVPGEGSIAFFEHYEPEGEGQPVEGAYDKRFFADAIPHGLSLLKLLTVRSNLGRLEEISKNVARFFICVWTHLGIMACISGESSHLGGVEREALALPLTYSMPKKDGGPRRTAPSVGAKKPEAPAQAGPPKPAAAEKTAPAPKPAPVQEKKKEPEASATEKPAAAAEKKEPQPEGKEAESEKKTAAGEEKKDKPAEGEEKPAE